MVIIMKDDTSIRIFSILYAFKIKRKTPPISDTIKWFNATYAVLTEDNGGDLNAIGGFDKSFISKRLVRSLLVRWWGVSDRKTADETFNSMFSVGHRQRFSDYFNRQYEDGVFDIPLDKLDAYLDESGFDKTDKSYFIAMMNIYKEKGESAIDAWDYCRFLQLLGFYYVAGYYSLQETLDKSLEIAPMIQQQYSSWAELLESYLNGYHFWQQDDSNDPNSLTANRISLYNKLKESDHSPYTLDWNTKLEKTW